MPWDYPSECVRGQLIISQLRMKPPHPSVNGVERHSGHPTQTRDWERISRGRELENLTGCVQRRENCYHLGFAVPAIGCLKCRTGFRSKSEVDGVDDGRVGLESEPGFHGGCLCRLASSVGGKTVA